MTFDSNETFCWVHFTAISPWGLTYQHLSMKHGGFNTEDADLHAPQNLDLADHIGTCFGCQEYLL